MSHDPAARPSAQAATWVLLHGTPLAPAVWHPTASLLADQPVLVPDCTKVPALRAQEALAEGVAALIGDRVVDVVGHSFGGQIALDLALLLPRQVRSLTVLCSRDTPYPAFADVVEAVLSGNMPTPAATLARWFTPAELSNGGQAVRVARQLLEDASPSDWAHALTAIAAYQRSDRTPELSMPVTLYAAGDDTVSTPEAMTDTARRIQRARLRVHRGWRHMSPFVDPVALAGLLTQGRDRSLAEPDLARLPT